MLVARHLWGELGLEATLDRLAPRTSTAWTATTSTIAAAMPTTPSWQPSATISGSIRVAEDFIGPHPGRDRRAATIDHSMKDDFSRTTSEA